MLASKNPRLHDGELAACLIAEDFNVREAVAPLSADCVEELLFVDD